MILTAEIARNIWRYDPSTGHFFWLISPKYDVAIWDKAGFFDGRYWRLRFKRKNYKASRVAWLYVTGKWPLNQIDHKNGNKLDDSFSNLRGATNAENCRNRRVRSDNKLGIKGVYQKKNGFVACVTVDGRPVLNKYFKTLAGAKAAYDAAATGSHGDYARL
jgi:hypothetical protein